MNVYVTDPPFYDKAVTDIPFSRFLNAQSMLGGLVPMECLRAMEIIVILQLLHSWLPRGSKLLFLFDFQL